MNRAPFDQLLRSSTQDPAHELAMFGSGEKLKRIEKLEASVSLMAQEMQRILLRMDEMSKHLGEDGMDIRSMKSEMRRKADKNEHTQVVRMVSDKQRLFAQEVRFSLQTQAEEFKRLGETAKIALRRFGIMLDLDDNRLKIIEELLNISQPRPRSEESPSRDNQQAVVPARRQANHREPLYIEPPPDDEE